jgi:hypothetical protein
MTDFLEFLSAVTPVLSAIAGGLIGFLSARVMWATQEATRKRSVAQGFLLELMSLEKPVTGWPKVIANPPGGGTVRIQTPLYPAHGLYFALQKEIFSFQPALAGGLYQFYRRLLEAEALRQTPTTDPSYRVVLEMVQADLTKAGDQLPALKDQLREVLGANALPAPELLDA